MKSTLLTRQIALPEASLIAGATACAYLAALAYRAGQMLRFGLPVSLAAASLSDAAFAGLIVLLVGVVAFVLQDYAESRSPGAMQRLIAAMLVGAFLILLALVEMFVLLVTVRLATQPPFWWALAVGLVAALAVYVLWAWVLNWVLHAHPRLDSTAAIARRNPTVFSAVMLACLICGLALAYGWAGVAIPGQPVLVTRSTREVAVAVSDQRAVLAGVESASSTDATLSGSLRVVPLPSDEISFAVSGITRIHAASK